MRHPVAMLAATLALVALTPASASAELTEFDTCSQVVDYARASLDDGSYPEYVSTFDGWLDARKPYPDPDAPDPNETTQDGYDDNDDVVVDDTASAPAAGEATGGSSDDSSTTNNQETGVDEPDVVKNDGQRLFVFAGDALRVYDGRQDVPRLIGTRALDLADGTLLRSGDKLLAIGQKPRPKRDASDADDWYSGTARSAEYPLVTRLIELDISDPAQPRLLRTLDAPGRLITARQVGETIRLVVDSEPDVDLYNYPYLSEAQQDKFERRLGLRDLVPRTRLRSAVTGARYIRPIAECDDISRPTAVSGVELLSVLTVDMGRGLVAVDRKGVMASPQVVYASAGALYVGSARSTGWYDDDAEQLEANTYTDIYAFDTTQPGETTYAGSGRVLGLPLNQYAFSEWNGDLRVATTTNPWWFDEEEAPADNRVTVLRRGAGVLTQVGLLTGMGKGETIHAVRFYGDRGYLVTFRQTDPLFTLDLADPTAPKVLGELKIPGYSAYLHPLGDDLLLGIGQDGDGRGRNTGAQASLFDVSDPRHPRRLADRKLGPGYARSDYDPHAFLWWPRKQMALVPYAGRMGYWYWGTTSNEGDPSALVALQAKRGPSPNLVELGRILHGPRWDHPVPQRAVVMGERLFSISALGIASNRVEGLESLGFVPFVYGGGWPPVVAPTTPTSTTPTTPVATTPATTPASTPQTK